MICSIFLPWFLLIVYPILFPLCLTLGTSMSESFVRGLGHIYSQSCLWTAFRASYLILVHDRCPETCPHVLVGTALLWLNMEGMTGLMISPCWVWEARSCSCYHDRCSEASFLWGVVSWPICLCTMLRCIFEFLPLAYLIWIAVLLSLLYIWSTCIWT